MTRSGQFGTKLIHLGFLSFHVSSSMEVQLVNRVGQPEPDTSVFESGTTSGTDNDQRADGTANGFIASNAIIVGSLSMPAQQATNHMADATQREPPARDAGGDVPRESSVDLMWRLRKYLLLLAVLAVSVTYNAGLTPPGGFWTKNKHGHLAGDPLLPVKFCQRYEVFFYCNATAFAASLVLIILLLSKEVTSLRVWLRSMQATMILDLFSLMGAYAAGSGRTLKSSIYMLVLVFAVFLYIGIHILIFIRVVPEWLKEYVQTILNRILEKVQTMLNQMLSIRGVSERQSSRHQDEEEKIEEARKFILMLATFAATITYQAGLNQPGGFWTENEQNHRPATSVLHSHYLSRFNVFVSCNATSFVASLVTIILILSPELSRHGIRSKALIVCVVADLLGLIGAYAAGCCRDMATSFYVMFIAFIVFIFIALLAGIFVYQPVAEWLGNIKKSCFLPFVDRVLSWPFSSSRSPNASHRQPGDVEAPTEKSASITEHQSEDSQQASNTKEGESQGELQAEGEQQVANTEEDVPNAELPFTEKQKAGNPKDVVSNVKHQAAECQLCATTEEAMSSAENTSVNFQQVANANDVMSNREHHSADNQQVSNTNDAMSNPEHLSADNQQVANTKGQSSLTEDLNIPVLAVEGSSEQNRLASDSMRATNNPPVEDGHSNGQEDSAERHTGDKVECTKNCKPTDEHQKKIRTYLLLLAILAVSLTYQSGLNPPGGFWSRSEDNHFAGDLILEDTHHLRYIAFFYFNATAFMASLVMIIVLLNKKISDKVTKRRALPTAMIVDLLALTGSFIMGSCRETKKSIHISVLICLVVAYVGVHVLISIHVIPKRWKKLVIEKLKKISCGQVCVPHPVNSQTVAINKDLERRCNLLLMLSVLAATVTYQAGMNPPGGVWSDDKERSGTPGDPILQDNHPKRYDVFYYSNSVSFISSVVITILLVNKESYEHGIKSYALRVCLVVGLLGLLIAYAAGSCRNAKQSIYLIIIAVAVLISLVIQVFIISSTNNTPFGRFIKRLQQCFLCTKEVGPKTTSESPESIDKKKEKKKRKRHKYLMLLAILAASITYQAGLNPPGGFWSDDINGFVAGDPVLHDIHPLRYKMFFCFNAISFMASVVVIMLLLSKSVRKKDVPLEVLYLIMVFDLLALMIAFAAGSCRKLRTSAYVFVLVFGVLIYLMIVIVLSNGIAKCLKNRWRCWRAGDASETNTPVPRPKI